MDYMEIEADVDYESTLYEGNGRKGGGGQTAPGRGTSRLRRAAQAVRAFAGRVTRRRRQ